MISNYVFNKKNNQCFLYESKAKEIFGFWLYLISDCIIFATMFAVYFVMLHGVSEGPTGKEIFQLSIVALETFFLLCTTIFSGAMNIAASKNSIKYVIISLLINLILGFCFISLELLEFYHLVIEGYGPNRNGFLSAFFTLVSMHGIHVFFGLIWIMIIMCQCFRFGITRTMYIRIRCLSLFWHFLDIIWICIFTFIYLIGVL